MRILAVPHVVALLLGAPTAAQEPAPIQGIVIDEASWTPVAGAAVSLVGTELRTQSLGNGTFAFPDAPVGPVTIRVEAPGFPTLTQEAFVVRGSVVYAQFLLPRIEALLDEIIVVGRRGRNVELGSPRTAADLLVGEVPGILTNSGQVGTYESRVQLRGVNSINLETAPIVYLDGVRLAGGVGQTLALLSQIPAYDVEEIEVLRGPASAFLTGAADGVIHVRTKSGPKPRN